MLYNVQGLRAIASLLVVHAHAAGVGLGLAWVGGMNGVDLFFVISGFIIAHVAAQDASQFMVRRMIRIVPIYWASTTAIFVLVHVVPQVFRTTSPDLVLYLKSLLFIPAGFNVHTGDGLPHPTLAGGWTLNYEMYFYVVFALALVVLRRAASWIAIGVIAAVVAIVQLAGITSPVPRFYGYPIVLEFAYGILAFHLVTLVEARAKVAPLPAIVKPLLIVVVVAGLGCLAFDQELFGNAPRWFASGIPAFFILVAALLLERVFGMRVTNKLVVAIGDASYVLYLLHAYIVFGITRLLLKHVQFDEWSGQLVSLGLMAASVAVAIAVYQYIELPMLRRLKRLLLDRSRRPAPPASAG